MIVTMEPALTGFASLRQSRGWIPAPRFHEDKLRGNDRGGCLLRASFKLVPTRVLRGVQRGGPPQADAGSLRVSL